MRRSLATSLVLVLALPFVGSVAGARSPKEAADPPAQPADATRQMTPESYQSAAGFYAAGVLSDYHYAKRPIDDRIARVWLDVYLDDLDPLHLFFLDGDVKDFQGRAAEIDDDIRAERPDYDLAFDAFTRYRLRAKEAYGFAKQVLDEDLTFDDPAAEVVVDREDAPWSKDKAARETIWRGWVHSQVLDALMQGETIESAREKLHKRFDRSIRNLERMDNRDVTEIYLTSLATVFDPHSAYFKPSSSEDFDIRMRDSLEGIGAELRGEDGYTKIVRLIPGGPAEATGELNKGDLILAVAQGAEEAVDVVEMRLDDVVNLIRGPKDSEVRLTIRPAADPSMTKIVSITRDKVVLERVSAKAELREVKGADGKTLKVGVIEVPSFYVDSWSARNSPDTRSTTNDVRRHIESLREQGAEALLLDLRGNGGGALSEALSLTGLFIDQGPVVQINDPKSGVSVLEDHDRGVAWSGPLVIATDELSASASEIFAGAIQDYGRGLVVGAPQTHGKGTVQQMVDLGALPRTAALRAEADKMGALKFTVQKFYRISGASTQRKGVVPDVVIPSPWEGIDVLEGDLDRALPYDEVDAARYTPLPMTVDVPAMQGASAARVASEPLFGWLAEDVSERKARKDQDSVSLHRETREKERQERIDKLNARRKALGIPELKTATDEGLVPVEDEDEETEGPFADLDEALDAAILDEALAITADFTGRWNRPPALADADTHKVKGR